MVSVPNVKSEGGTGIRLFALLAFTLCLLGQAADVAHFLLIRHKTCVEHGALVHSPNGADQEDDHALGERSLEGMRSPTVADDDDHDHCFLVLERPKIPEPNRVSVPPQILVATSFKVIAPFSVSSFSKTVLYRLAPKTSPPVLI